MCELTMRLLLAWLLLRTRGRAALGRPRRRWRRRAGPRGSHASPPRPAPALGTRAEQGNWFGKVCCLVGLAVAGWPRLGSVECSVFWLNGLLGRAEPRRP